MDWKRLLNIKSEPTFGLDIGSSSVKLLQLQKNGNDYSVTAAAISDVEKNEAVTGDEDTSSSAAIRTCMQVTGIESRSAVCGVCGPEVAVREFKFPALSPEELEGAITLEAGQACPFSISESVVDHQILSRGPEGVSGVLVAATQKLIENKIRSASKAELKTVLMDVDGLAILNCFKQTNQILQGQTTTILNIGNSCATLAILGDDNSVFVRDIQHAGEHIIAEIASAKSLAREWVKEILYGQGLNGSQIEPQIVQKACQRLIGDVTDTLRYYTAQQKSAFVDKIYLCGGFAIVKGFAEFLGSQLPAKVILWNPFEKINCQEQYKDIVQKNGPALAVAAGLAMRTI